jgi:hypothetical protein
MPRRSRDCASVYAPRGNALVLARRDASGININNSNKFHALQQIHEQKIEKIAQTGDADACKPGVKGREVDSVCVSDVYSGR